MGEYWKPVNMTRREYIHPHKVNCGLKLPEWNWLGSSVWKRINALIESGRWSEDDDIRALSDYGGELQLKGTPKHGPHEDLEELCETYLDVSWLVGRE